MHRLFAVLRDRSWSIELQPPQVNWLPAPVASRYPKLPPEVGMLLSQILNCSNAEEDSWLLGPADFAPAANGAFRWNEYELMALDTAESDGQRAGIRAFWDRHFPFWLATHSAYDYLAISLVPDHFGAVVHGSAPEWELPTPVAPSFVAFLEATVLKADAGVAGYPLSLFI